MKLLLNSKQSIQKLLYPTFSVKPPDHLIKKLKYQDIPTLRSFPFIGHSYLFFPGGKYKSERLTEAIIDISKKLGSIFRLKLGGTDMVITLNPESARTLFRNEGTHPIRPPFPALLYYRNQAFGSSGVVPGNGEEWYKLRKGVTPLLKPNIVAAYKSQHLEIAKTFVSVIKTERNKKYIIEDIYPFLIKFTIEAISVVSPGKRFHCFSKNDDQTKKIIEASIDFMDGLYKTLIEPPIWKFWKTEGYKKLESSHTTIFNILKNYLDEISQKMSTEPEVKESQPYLYSLFSNPNLSSDDKRMLALEVFLGGIDATATTLAFTLYYLAQNSEVQEIASTSLSTDTEFLRACIKETLRLSPTAGANSRFLIHDTLFDNYEVPKGTLILSFNSATSTNEKYFKQANKYYPQRFMKETREDHHRFASLPFGHGPRMCPGRRIAESEIIILLKEILTHFKLESSEGPEVGMVYRMNRIPDRPIGIKFVDRNH